MPLPNTPEFENVRGREGDLIVIQHRSSAGARGGRIAALRTLGLKGVRSASLRRSDDATTWGNIAKVRDLVCVIELSKVESKESYEISSQRNTAVTNSLYGSGTQPGSIWRDASDEYFGFESDREWLRAYWSTEVTFEGFLHAIKEVGLEPDVEDPNSYMTAISDGEMAQYDGPFGDLKEKVAGLVVSGAALVVDEGIDVFWRAPYQRFYDSRTVRAEMGILSSPPDPSAVSRLLIASNDAERVRDYGALVEIRTAGNLRKIRV